MTLTYLNLAAAAFLEASFNTKLNNNSKETNGTPDPCFKASIYYGVVRKHCNLNTKIDSSPSANNETLQKLLWWFTIVLIFKKVWKQIFENDYYGFKEEIFNRNFIEFKDQSPQKFTSILLLQAKNDKFLEV